MVRRYWDSFFSVLGLKSEEVFLMNLNGFAIKGMKKWAPVVSQMFILFVVEVVPVALAALGVVVVNGHCYFGGISHCISFGFV